MPPLEWVLDDRLVTLQPALDVDRSFIAKAIQVPAALFENSAAAAENQRDERR